MRGPSSATLFFACFFVSVDSRAHDAAILSRRTVPEIGGSQGGFIGLVVALSVLILICCIAVFFLLRNHEPSEQDRISRRERYRRNRDNQENDSTAGRSFFGDKLRGMWPDKWSSRSRSGGRRGGRGWIQAGSGDEWEINSDHGEEHRAQQPMQPFSRSFQEGPYSPQAPEMDSPLSDAESYAPMHYGDPYAKGPLHVTSPQRVTFARSQSPLSQSSSPMSRGSHRDASMDDEEVRPPDHRHFSTQSSTSVRTFEGGTKFIESF
ncbi:uncharacterized protein EDB93DRAFT_1092468 [Suillus bovinus]|uniref:uncharacterized protein n=1 Tax=Suillus bovinus TaxID=48563 RepID=UPI001B87000A|nr:uncharacterized protein EDB93DRAFT_1092468 [Suillus bovinus]KAG2135180.1 hypothetical protein EDB93DRAFT_1092468 [Suillus bovinus]